MKLLTNDSQEEIKILPMGLIEGRILARVNDDEFLQLIDKDSF